MDTITNPREAVPKKANADGSYSEYEYFGRNAPHINIELWKKRNLYPGD
jgi:hypothetical protein